MKRNSTTLFLETSNAITPIPWNNGNPDFSAFSESTLSVLANTWNAFLESDEQLEIIPDPETPPVVNPPNFDGFINAISYTPQYPLIQAWYNTIPAVTRDPLQNAIGNQDLAMINERLIKTVAVYPPDQETAAQIIQALNDFDIPIDLGFQDEVGY